MIKPKTKQLLTLYFLTLRDIRQAKQRENKDPDSFRRRRYFYSYSALLFCSLFAVHCVTAPLLQSTRCWLPGSWQTAPDCAIQSPGCPHSLPHCTQSTWHSAVCPAWPLLLLLTHIVQCAVKSDLPPSPCLHVILLIVKNTHFIWSVSGRKINKKLELLEKNSFLLPNRK